MDLRQLMATLKARWRLAGLVFLACLLGAGAITSIIPQKYSSTTRVYFAAAGATSGVDTYNLSFYAQQRVLSYAQLATDPSLLGRVVEETDLPITVEQLASQVTVAVPVNTAILEITVVDANPGSAQDLARAEADEISKLVETLEAQTPADGGEKTLAPITATPAGEPSYNDNPISPNLMLNLIIGALFGVILAVVAAVIREMFDSSFKSTRDVATLLGVPVLGVVPDDAASRKQPVIEAGDPTGRGEPYRVLRTNLQFVDLDAKQQMFVITSAVKDEGKTSVAVNLAIAMAQTGRSVLLIDGDLRNPEAADLLGLSNTMGLMTAITGEATLADCVQTHESGLRFLGTGPLPPNPTEVLDTEAMRNMLRMTQDDYDIVIIDTPAALPSADAAILASTVGNVVLAVRVGKTPRDLVREAVERLQVVEARVTGTVATMVPKREIRSPGEAELPQVAQARSIRRGKEDGLHTRDRK